MNKDDFGDRMKYYEQSYTEKRVPITQILCVRIDGKGFSKFTEGFKKPFDDTLTCAMVETAKRLVKDTHARLSYTQSDEITLIYSPSGKSREYLFGGRVSKLNSILASMASVHFNDILRSLSYEGKSAFFDCRVWGVPNITEASNVILWRAQDARKNSISSLFRWTAGHAKMAGLSGKQMKEVLQSEYSTNWEDLPNKYKYGTFIKPITVERFLTSAEIERIPENDRPETNNMVKRTEIQEIDVGFFGDYSIEQRINFLKRDY
jgi:tRNA(His) guanylyltransferase